VALKVLLADDSVPAQNMGKKILVDAGYEVTTVGNGLEAMRKIKDAAPDIAILDIFMPGYSGLEVCRFLRADDKTAELPVILTVGKLEPYRPEDGEGVRSNAVLVKPFASEELTSAVRSLAGAGDDVLAATRAESPVGTGEQEAAAPAVAAAEEMPAEATAENRAAKAVAAAASHDVRQNAVQQDEEDELPFTYQSSPELSEPPLDRFGSSRVEIGIDISGQLGSDAESRQPGGAPYTPGAESTKFQASVFDTIGHETKEDGQTSIVSFDQSALNEFEISPEPLLSSQIVDPEAGQQSWYTAEEIDPETDYSAKASEVEVEPLVESVVDGPVSTEAPAAESVAPELDTEDVEAAVTEESAAEAAPDTDPLFEVAEQDAPSSFADAVEEEASETAVELEPAGDANEVWAEEASQASNNEVDTADEPIFAAAVPANEEARRAAFEALFNSDVPFPLQEDFRGEAEFKSEAEAQNADADAAEPLELEAEPELETVELSALDGEEEAAALPSSDALAEADPSDEPHFYTAELQEELLETTAAESPSAYDGAVERTELVAEVAKVEALLEQMRAMRQSEADPQASSAMEESTGQETSPLEDMAVTGASEFVEEPPLAGSCPEESAAAPQTGSEVEAFLPSPGSEQSGQEFQAQSEAALAEALAEEASAQAAGNDSGSDPAQNGRIQGAVEKVFERFRPLLVAAIAEELRRRD
jgi:CheY-like chemotaxis protein